MKADRLTRENVILKVEDGTQMAAYVARVKDAKAIPGIIVLQEAYGGELAHSPRYRAPGRGRLRRHRSRIVPPDCAGISG
jgi:hypothetical protein